jgi:hypothetical protein
MVLCSGASACPAVPMVRSVLFNDTHEIRNEEGSITGHLGNLGLDGASDVFLQREILFWFRKLML